jgi:hypothetical protein
MTVRLTRFNAQFRLVDERGYLTPAGIDVLNRFVKETETAINLQPTIEAAAEAANTAAAAANAAVEQIESGDFAVQAITLNGQRLIWDGSSVVAEP